MNTSFSTLEKIDELMMMILDNKIYLHETDYDNIKIAAFKVNEVRAILYNPDKFETYVEEFVALYHEFLHILNDCFYYIHTSSFLRNKKEQRIKSLLIEQLVPLDVFCRLINLQYKRWEIAEELNVTEELINQACEFYDRKGLLNIRYDYDD